MKHRLFSLGLMDRDDTSPLYQEDITFGSSLTLVLHQPELGFRITHFAGRLRIELIVQAFRTGGHLFHICSGGYGSQACSRFF